MRLTNSGTRVKVYQDEPEDLVVTIHHEDRVPHYAECEHGALTTIWDPASGYHIHMTSLTVSVESAGVLTVQHGTTVFMTMHFAEKKSWPVHSGGDVTFDEDAILKATFTADNATDSAFITAFGHEHEG